jgi:hypothetical protein
MAEDDHYYHVQIDLHSLETVKFHKCDNGYIYQVVERS